MTTDTPRISIEQSTDAFFTWGDPPTFLADVTGEHLYEKQKEFARALATERRIAVSGGNSTGKDWLAGRLILWWEVTHSPAKVVVIGPTHRQVRDIVWANTREAYRKATDRGKHLDGTMLKTRWDLDEESYAVGFATDDENNIQGFHSPHLLVIITEAHAVEDKYIDAAMRLMPECIIMTGNPFSIGGTFYDAFHEDRDRWYTINISAYDTPNIRAKDVRVPGLITMEDIADRIDEVGEGSPLFIAGVLGEFPESLEDSLVPLSWSKAATDRTLEPTSPNILAIDVARFGADKSVAVHRRGPVARIIWRAQGMSTTAVAGRAARMCEDLPEKGVLVVDGVGVGAGVIDTLRDNFGNTVHGWRLMEFQGGGTKRIDKEHYVNAIAEAYGRMRSAFLHNEVDIGVGGGVPKQALDALVGQMSARKFTYRGDKRMQLQSKEDIKKSGGTSPDEADALAMTYTPEAAMQSRMTGGFDSDDMDGGHGIFRPPDNSGFQGGGRSEGGGFSDPDGASRWM